MRRIKPVEVLVVVGIVALVISVLLPSFMLYITVKNATSSRLDVHSVYIGGNWNNGITLQPGEQKRLKIFSGDGNQETMNFAIIAVDNTGRLVSSSVHKATDLLGETLLTIDNQTATTRPLSPTTAPSAVP
ncbi:MAG TPA: hypothetical protein VF669_11280 [Tepidisphaeraceae bacterium]|jgi:hypothetical protein